MTTYRKKRGDDFTKGGDNISLDERRRQWNSELASRTLASMYGNTDVDENTTVVSRFRSVRYTARELYEKGRQYFEDIVEKNEEGTTIIPDIEDFCMFANISRQRFMEYRRSEDVEMSEVACNIANAIASCKKQNAMNGMINPTIFAIDFNNNHDYVQAKTEITMNSNVSLQQLETNIADIESRIPMEDIPAIEEARD